MTDPNGNSESCLPETLPPGEAEGNIEVQWKQNALLPTEPVIKYFAILPNSKIKTNLRSNRLFIHLS